MSEIADSEALQALEARARAAGITLSDEDRAALLESAAPVAAITASVRKPRAVTAEPAHVYRLQGRGGLATDDPA